jgi:hypothetical protein
MAAQARCGAGWLGAAARALAAGDARTSQRGARPSCHTARPSSRVVAPRPPPGPPPAPGPSVSPTSCPPTLGSPGVRPPRGTPAGLTRPAARLADGLWQSCGRGAGRARRSRGHRRHGGPSGGRDDGSVAPGVPGHSQPAPTHATTEPPLGLDGIERLAPRQAMAPLRSPPGTHQQRERCVGTQRGRARQGARGTSPALAEHPGDRVAREAWAQCSHVHRGLLRRVSVEVVVDSNATTALRQKPFHVSAFWRRYWPIRYIRVDKEVSFITSLRKKRPTWRFAYPLAAVPLSSVHRRTCGVSPGFRGQHNPSPICTIRHISP